MALLGKSWSSLIIAGAKAGLIGTPGMIGDVSFEQCAKVYESGAEIGAAPDIVSFRQGLSSSIYEKLCASEDISTMDKIKLASDLGKWAFARGGGLDDDVMDIDAEVDTPMFTKTGLWVLDKIVGESGVPQEVVTILARPEAGKSSLAVSLMCEWRRSAIGPVSFIQTELSPAAMRMKIDGQCRGENLWRSGEDRMVFGRLAAQNELDRCTEEGDPDRLIIFDSVTGHCGSGDTPDGRMRHVNLYDSLMQAKNKNRLVVATGHVKQGEEVFSIESAAGSAVIGRMSGVIVCLDKVDAIRRDGRGEIQISTVKNRYSGKQSSFKFAYDYVTGEAIPLNSDEWED
jgi:predicted ATP-dependent serine protease